MFLYVIIEILTINFFYSPCDLEFILSTAHDNLMLNQELLLVKFIFLSLSVTKNLANKQNISAPIAHIFTFA